MMRVKFPTSARLRLAAQLVVVAAAMASELRAGDGPLCGPYDSRERYRCWCCDNYCVKPPVMIKCPPPLCGCDDYCAKPPVKVPCPGPYCGCDDYCPKCPKLLINCWNPYYTCGPKCNCPN